MFGFGKKQTTAVADKVDTTPPPVTADVYVMPEKYIVQGPTGNNKGLIIASIILLLVIVVTGSYLIYDMVGRQQATPTPQTTPPVIEAIEQPVVEPLVATTSTEATTTEITEETVTTTPTTTPAQSAVIINSQDSDADGLTDVEENVFGSLPTNPDTDADGYKDGNEVASGYNPTKAGTSRISDSPFIATQTTDFGTDDFSLLYPKDWQTSIIKASEQLLLTAPSGEIIKISVRVNQQALSALSWYLQDHPETSVSQLKLVDTLDGQLTGIYAPDSLAAYLTDASKSKFYVFEYLTGRQSEIRYPAIFNMIIKSLKVLPKAATTAVVSFNNNANPLLKSQCVSTRTFCQLNPCGPLADGSNSCTDDNQGYCYEKECVVDADCISGKKCQPLECYSGDAARGVKLCQ